MVLSAQLDLSSQDACHWRRCASKSAENSVITHNVIAAEILPAEINTKAAVMTAMQARCYFPAWMDNYV